MSYYYDDDTEYNEKCIELDKFKTKYSTDNNEWTYVNLNDIKVDDKIFITFCPDSQKYINSLYPLFGIVSNILPENSNPDSDFTIERLELTNEEGKKYSAAHGWCGYYGDSRSYYYSIYKLTELEIDPKLENDLDEKVIKKRKLNK